MGATKARQSGADEAVRERDFPSTRGPYLQLQTARSDTSVVPEPLKNALDRLERALAANDWPVVRGLRPGLSEVDIRQRLADIGFDPPEDLIDAFTWHDGYDQPDDQLPGWQGGWITPRLCVASLSQSLSSYDLIWPDFEEQYDEPEGRWFPVFNGPIGTVVINCGDDPSTRGSVSVWDPVDGLSEGYRPASLAEPADWWANWLETGDYYWLPDFNGAPAALSRLDAAILTPEQQSSGIW